MGHFQKSQWIPTLHHNQCLRYRGKRCFGTEASRVGEVSEFTSGCARRGLSNRSLIKWKWTEVKNKTQLFALTLNTWEAWHFYLDSVIPYVRTFMCQMPVMLAYGYFSLLWLVQRTRCIVLTILCCKYPWNGFVR